MFAQIMPADAKSLGELSWAIVFIIIVANQVKNLLSKPSKSSDDDPVKKSELKEELARVREDLARAKEDFSAKQQITAERVVTLSREYTDLSKYAQESVAQLERSLHKIEMGIQFSNQETRQEIGERLATVDSRLARMEAKLESYPPKRGST